jgi:hypothetical protein
MLYRIGVEEEALSEHFGEEYLNLFTGHEAAGARSLLKEHDVKRE